MKPINPIIGVNEIVKQFASAVQVKDIRLVASLLADDGEFNTQDEDLNTIDNSTKTAFIQWLTTALSVTEISKIEYDQCLYCKIGNPVVLFNNGKFPPIKREMSSKCKTGLMLDIKDGLIREIAFCYTFLERENCYQYECPEQKKEIDSLVAMGIPLREAVNIMLKNRGYI
jgi:hypothetical protein